ncbi:helix-turn-helix domain-containing protein [Catenulispora subtropica]|uniref:Helix-turn-helix domain-containing protein n=1 Tax=Catenulispora subtropica TaxID=450798 RepID=A0ABP5D772_9ACTN
MQHERHGGLCEELRPIASMTRGAITTYAKHNPAGTGSRRIRDQATAGVDVVWYDSRVTSPRNLTAQQLAAALGKSESTVNRLARNGDIPYDQTTSGRRFDADEVRNALEQRERAPVAPPARSRGMGGWLTDALDLEAWAERKGAEDELPTLVRKLVAGSGATLKRLEMRTDEGVRLPGWDGLAEAVVGTAHVPEGLSVWEMGAGDDPISKANSDYAKRSGDPLGLNPADTTFVFVTPRRWGSREVWEQEKKGEKIWKDVRAYDADSLAHWLETLPAVHADVTRMLGRDPSGGDTVPTAWSKWSGETIPPLSADLLTAGRSAEVEAVQCLIQSSPTSLWVAADSVDEAYGFILAALVSTFDAQGAALETRAMVVNTAQAWEEVLTKAGDRFPHILVPRFPQPQVTRAVAAGHRVIVPIDRMTRPGGDTVTLKRLSRSTLYGTFVAEGFSTQQAVEMSQLARRSVTAFRRRYASDGTAAPAWAQPETTTKLASIVLAGAWHENDSLEAGNSQPYSADEEVLSTLAGQPYPEVSALCARLATEPDQPVGRVGNVWYFVSKLDTWLLASPSITMDQLRRFKEATTTVLSELNPLLRVDPADRWKAATNYIGRKYSGELRAGIADSLAMIAVHTGDALLAGRNQGSVFVGNLVKEILHKTDSSEAAELLVSLSDVLPSIAEASPDSFLEAVDSFVDGGQPSFVFDPETESALLAGQPPHTGLLWALEVLAWSPDHFGSVAVALAHLAQLDPGGKAANRPSRSLRQIFQPFDPQTTVDAQTRFMVLDHLRQTTPEVAWQLLLSLLPAPLAIEDYSSQPRWRDWPAEKQPPTADERLRHPEEVLSRLLKDVGTDASRWIEIIPAYPNLLAPLRIQLLEGIGRLEPTDFSETDRTRIAEALTKVVQPHRRFASANWALASDDIDPLEIELARFRVQDATAPDAWLFAHTAAVGPWTGDYEAERTEIDRRRETAVGELIANMGMNGVVALASACELPGLVGVALSRTGSDLDEEAFSYITSNEPSLRLFAAGYISGRFEADGWTWAADHLVRAGTWDDEKAIGFLLALPADETTLLAVQTLGQGVQDGFWDRAHPLRFRDPATYEIAAEALLGRGRLRDVVTLLAYPAQAGADLNPDLIMRALDGALPSSDNNDTVMFTHELNMLLAYLDRQPQVSIAQVAQLEWRYLPFLERPNRPALALHKGLAQDPDFFVTAVGAAFRSEHNEEERSLSPAELDRATRAYELLRTWKTVPGGETAEGTLNLSDWVDQASSMLKERGLLRPGMSQLGQVLAHVPEGADGSWPPAEVTTVIERLRSPVLEDGIKVGSYNRRGFTWRGTESGGEQERRLADRYREYAKKHVAAPRTKKLLNQIAEMWDSEAQREDISADHQQDF